MEWLEIHELDSLEDTDLTTEQMAALILANEMRTNGNTFLITMALANLDKSVDEINDLIHRLNKPSKLAEYIYNAMDTELLLNLATTVAED